VLAPLDVTNPNPHNHSTRGYRADERGRQGGSDVHVGVADVSERILQACWRVRRHTDAFVYYGFLLHVVVQYGLISRTRYQRNPNFYVCK